MIDIYIKSFNRPYYLERCIISIEKMLEGNYCINILDDGTPEKYLKKIKDKYPKVIIKTSKSYLEKNRAVKESVLTGKNIDGFTIPTDLWFEAVKNGSEYCIVTEDDVWFTQPININILQEKARVHNICLLKLGLLHNLRDDQYININEIDQQIENNIPKKIFTGPKWLMDLFFYNKFKFFTIAYKLDIFDNYTRRKYWTLNSILMGFWKRDYWLEVWKDAKGKLDEKQQLRNAAAYYHKSKNNPNFIARLKEEAMETTFQSSATNSYHEYGYNFDVNYFNYLMNEAWYNDEFDSMQNFPNDFTIDYLTSFFDEKLDREEFEGWTEQFKNQYRNLGCNI